MIVLTRDEVRDCVGMPEAVRSVETALWAVADGAAQVPLRTEIRTSDDALITRSMPGILPGMEVAGCKLIAEAPTNRSRNLPSLTGLMVLFDYATGFPVAAMDATYLTNLRTGALTAVAAKHLAPRDVRAATVVGTGGLAPYQVLGLLEVLDVPRVHVWGRVRDRAQSVVDEVAVAGGGVGRVEVTADLEGAVRRSDLVVVATSAREPVIEDSWVTGNALVCSLSGEGPEAREIPSELVSRADRVIVDSRVATASRAGELRASIDDGLLDPSRITELGPVTAGTEIGRQHENELLVFKSCGMAALDLAVSRLVSARAVEQGLGTRIDVLGLGSQLETEAT